MKNTNINNDIDNDSKSHSNSSNRKGFLARELSYTIARTHMLTHFAPVPAKTAEQIAIGLIHSAATEENNFR